MYSVLLVLPRLLLLLMFFDTVAAGVFVVAAVSVSNATFAA